jgi:ribosomal-protein-serine acetyltransferase
MDARDTAEHRGSVTEPPRITAAHVDFCLHVDERTEVRPLRAEDAAAVYDLTVRNRTHLAEWMPWPERVIDVSDTHAFLRDAEREAYEHRAFRAGIRRGGTLIGAVDLHDINWPNAHAGIGYWLDRDFMGQGIMTRAVRALSEYAFEALDLHRLEIHVAIANARSRRVAERAGFTFEGTLRQVQRLHDRFVDHALYSLLRDEAAR